MRALGIFLIGATIILFSIQSWLVLSPQYFENLQIDRPMHFAGGLVVALFAGLVIFSEQSLSSARGLPRWALVIILVSFAMLAGVLWELYEFAWDEWVAEPYGAFRAQPDTNDIMEDLMFDAGGALVASALFVWKVRARPHI